MSGKCRAAITREDGFPNQAPISSGAIGKPNLHLTRTGPTGRDTETFGVGSEVLASGRWCVYVSLAEAET
jgi:hypothetical protein